MYIVAEAMDEDDFQELLKKYGKNIKQNFIDAKKRIEAIQDAEKVLFEEKLFISKKEDFPEYPANGFDYKAKSGGYVKKDKSKLNVLGISTTVYPADRDKRLNRSASEDSLIYALNYVKEKYDCQVSMVRLNEIPFGQCEGYYSSNKKGCTWPCEVTRRDGDKDRMDVIYFGITAWADIVIISTPVRYGRPTALYFQMEERLNTVQNQISWKDNHLVKDKTACFIIPGGQDNIQFTAGHLMRFWGETGFHAPRYPYVGWARGWYAEDTRKTYELLASSKEYWLDLERMMDSAVDLQGRLAATKSTLDFADDHAKEQISFEDYDPAAFIPTGSIKRNRIS